MFSGHYGVWQASLRAEDRLFTTCRTAIELPAGRADAGAGGRPADLVMAEHYSARHFSREQVRNEQATFVQLIAMMVSPRCCCSRRAPATASISCATRSTSLPLSTAEKDGLRGPVRGAATQLLWVDESIGWAVTDPPVGERRGRRSDEPGWATRWASSMPTESAAAR